MLYDVPLILEQPLWTPSIRAERLRLCKTACSHRSTSRRRACAARSIAEGPTPRVHIATAPLVGWERLELVLGKRYPPQLAMHTMTVLEEGEGGPCTLYDFLPRNPTDAGTGARLLAGGSAPGQVRTRRLSRLPPRRCRLVAELDLSLPEALAVAEGFQEDWDAELQLFRHDCRHHTEALVNRLTGCNSAGLSLLVANPGAQPQR